MIVQNFCNTGVENVYLFLKWTAYVLLAATRSLWNRQGEAQTSWEVSQCVWRKKPSARTFSKTIVFFCLLTQEGCCENKSCIQPGPWKWSSGKHYCSCITQKCCWSQWIQEGVWFRVDISYYLLIGQAAFINLQALFIKLSLSFHPDKCCFCFLKLFYFHLIFF